jgi:hypothetical protein
MTKRTKLPTIVKGRSVRDDASMEKDPKVTFELEAETGEIFEVGFPPPASATSALEPRQQARCIPSLAAQLLDLRIELIDQRGDREVGPVSSCFSETNR